MDEEAFDIGLRKFLKMVGVTSQREIEQAVRAALAAGRIDPNARLQVRMVLTIEAIGLGHVIDGEIDLG